MGPDLYDVYLAMLMCMVVMYVLTETRTFWYNPHWRKIKKKILYKYLSRIRLMMLLIEFWNADKWKNTQTKSKWGQPGPSKMRNYCPYILFKAEGGVESAERFQRSLKSGFPE